MATKRRLLGSSLAALVLLAIGVPVALTARGSTTVQNVAAGTGDAAPAAQVDVPDEPDNSNDEADGAQEQQTDEVRVQVSDASTSFALQMITGDGAAEAAQAASAGADESPVIDEMTVWVDAEGDQRTVSALVEPDTFVAITGDADQLDVLIDLLRSGDGMSGFSFGGPGPHSFDFDKLPEEFRLDGFNFDAFGENFEGFPDGFDFDGFDFDELPDGFDFDFDSEHFSGFNFNLEGFGEDFNLDDFDFEGFGEDFNLDDFNFNFEFDNEHFSGFGDFGDTASLEDLVDKLEEHRGELEQFFATNEFGLPFGPDADGCVSIEGNTNGETFSFVFPEGCRSDG